jgi:hypothetical protein
MFCMSYGVTANFVPKFEESAKKSTREKWAVLASSGRNSGSALSSAPRLLMAARDSAAKEVRRNTPRGRGGEGDRLASGAVDCGHLCGRSQ